MKQQCRQLSDVPCFATSTLFHTLVYLTLLFGVGWHVAYDDKSDAPLIGLDKSHFLLSAIQPFLEHLKTWDA